MSFPLRQSTASQEVPLGHFLDDTDGKTAETALMIANTDIKLWKTGATSLANKNSGGGTHMAGGVYSAVMDATDTDTLGPMVAFVHVAGALPVKVEFDVLPANVYDARYGTDLLDVNTAQVGGTAQTAGDILADTNDIQARLPAALVGGRMDSSMGAVATGVIAAASFAAGALDAVWSTTSRTLTAFAFSVTVGTNNDKTGYALSSAGVQAIWDALTSALTTVGSIGKLLVDNINATISSRAVPADIPTAAANADAVWDEAIAGHLGAGSTGAALNAAGSSGDPWATPLPGAYGAGTAGNIVGNRLDAAVSTRASQTSVDTVDDFLDTEIAAIKAKTDNLPAQPAAVGSAMTLTTGERDAIADAKFDRVDGVETGMTERQALRGITSATFGKVSGAGTATEIFRAAVSDSKPRHTITANAQGDRTGVVSDLT